MTTTKDYVKLHDAWMELFSQHDWDLFCTFTYKTSVWVDEKVIRDFKRTHFIASAEQAGISKNNRTHRRRHRSEELPPYILAVEPHKSGTLHAHALIGRRRPGERADSIDKEIIERTWNETVRDAGFTSITPVRKNNRAKSYMVKTSRYCVKNPDAYLGWYGLGRMNPTLPVGLALE